MFLVPRLNQEAEIEKIYFNTLDTNMKSVGKGMENVKDWEKLELVADYNTVINKFKPSELVVFIDDVGRGETGKHLRELGYKVIGVDFDRTSIESCKKDNKYSNVEFQVGNAESLQMAEKYDVVIMTEILEHMEHPELGVDSVKADRV